MLVQTAETNRQTSDRGHPPADVEESGIYNGPPCGAIELHERGETVGQGGGGNCQGWMETEAGNV